MYKILGGYSSVTLLVFVYIINPSMSGHNILICALHINLHLYFAVFANLFFASCDKSLDLLRSIGKVARRGRTGYAAPVY